MTHFYIGLKNTFQNDIGFSWLQRSEPLTVDELPEHYYYASHIQKILVDVDNQITIVTQPMSLSELETYEYFDLPISKNKHYIDRICSEGRVDILKRIPIHGFPFQYTAVAIDSASANGHDSVLEWWKQSGLSLKYTSTAVYGATMNQHTNVLDWWLNSGLTMKYSSDIIDQAISESCDRSVEWWLRNTKIASEKTVLIAKY
jgi:hypothetical protein